MPVIKTASSALLAATLLLAPICARAADPAYLVASLKVSDLRKYMNEYGMPVFPMLQKAGAEVLVGTPKVDILEGDYDGTWTAIVRFPSMDALRGWYASTEYKAIAPKRRALSGEGSVLFAAPQFQMPEP